MTPEYCVLIGDCRTELKRLKSESVHCVVTSPPYFGLRDYGCAGQIGLEASPAAYVAELVAVFREVRRVLRPDGTLWLNLGDTANNRRRIRATSHQPSLNGFKELSWAQTTKLGLTRLSINDGDMKEKDAMGIPWRVAFALRADGWFLRQEIIWSKSFGKPEPSADRFPGRHESIFLMAKTKQYRFDRDKLPDYAKTSVWHIAPIGQRGHGAAFAEKVVRPCILAGCPAGGVVLDPFAGSGVTGMVANQLGRHAVLIDLNPAYATFMHRRIADTGQPA